MRQSMQEECRYIKVASYLNVNYSLFAGGLNFMKSVLTVDNLKEQEFLMDN